MDYLTVRAYASDEFCERKSRFIGHIAPVRTEEEAQAFIAQIAKEHREASHNVFAYLLREGGLSRCSDNGEPQGTAGVPVLEVLRREGLTDVCAVVTRYFGGILLGTGGLTRAYSHGAKLAVDAADILCMTPCVEAEVSCDYAFYGKLAYLLPEYGAKTEGSDFGERVTLRLLLREDRFEAMQKALTELSAGKVQALRTGGRYEDLPLP